MLLINLKIYTMADVGIIENGFIRVDEGKISEVGPMNILSDINDETIEFHGEQCFPGFIDAHTHLGMWEDSLGFEGDDGNEDTDPSTPQLRALDAINPMDKCFSDALAAGVTTVISGPGSANPVGGQLLALKTDGRRIDDMLVRCPVGIKFALGENPKTVYHAKSQAPVTRMATAAIIREQLFKAQKYKQQWEQYAEEEDMDEPEFDFKCEALLPLLKNEQQAYFHAHRPDDIFTAIRIAKEFSLDYTLVHCTGGHEISDLLAELGATALCGPLICDRSKPELSQLSPKSPAALTAAGVKVAIVTDHPVVPIQYLPLSAGIAVSEGMDYLEALKAITINAAEICGIEDKVGSIEIGKDADLCIFADNPLSSLHKPIAVFTGGRRAF